MLDSSPEKNDEDTGFAEIRDISGQVDADGTVHWVPPAEGTQSWEILRIGYTDSDARVSTSSGAWQGLAIDYLDPGRSMRTGRGVCCRCSTRANPMWGRA